LGSVDATSSSVSALISNTDIQGFLGGIKSKHTFLIADACFSGDIFRGKTITIPYENSFKYYNHCTPNHRARRLHQVVLNGYGWRKRRSFGLCLLPAKIVG
jgi:hypothetical protein